MKRERLVVSVGAGAPQYEFIKRLKERGFTVAAFGRGRNCQEAVKLCDYFKEIDTTNAEEAIAWLEELKVPVMAVGSYAGGVAVKTLQSIAAYFKLPNQIPAELMVGMNKLEQQIMYEKYKLSNIVTWSGEEMKDRVTEVKREADYIIKPAIGRGSSGITRVLGERLSREWKELINSSEDMIQEVVRGKEYRMLLMVQQGEIKLLAPVLRTSFRETFFLGRLEISFEDYKQIEQHAKKIICNMGIDSNIIKYDIIVNEKEVNLIEMDIGVGGGIYFKKYISMTVQKEIIDLYIDLICGEKISKTENFNSELVMDYIYNEQNCPVSFDMKKCEEEISKRTGEMVLLRNLLHSEKLAAYQSNADFLFTIIHEKKEISTEELNEYINRFLLNPEGIIQKQ